MTQKQALEMLTSSVKTIMESNQKLVREEGPASLSGIEAAILLVGTEISVMLRDIGTILAELLPGRDEAWEGGKGGAQNGHADD